MSNRPILYIITNNHFDPTWRRCWDRRFTFKGRTFVSYADLQDYYMADNLALARKHPAYRFEAESTLVVRHYLDRHPERQVELRALAAEGRFAVAGAGDNIIDTNLVLGESIVRNFVTGLLWLERNLGIQTRLGVRNDGFGSSAQVPQILRGCEIPWATGFFYSPITARFWRGLDGSVLCTAEVPLVALGGGCDKYPPCPACDGAGCRACAQRGIAPALRSRLPGDIDDGKMAEYGCGRVAMTPEEPLPNPAIFAWARRQRKRYDVRFATLEQLRPHVQRWIDRVDDPPEADVHGSVEANPNNSGVWVTRIKLKQACRRQEYALLAAETLSSLAALDGAAYPRRALQSVWRRLLFTLFHDAVTATHVDPAYAELLDVQAEIDAATAKVTRAALKRLLTPKPGAVSVINLTGGASTQVVSAVLDARNGPPTVTGPDGKPADVVDARRVGRGRVRVEFIARNVPALSARVYRVGTKAPVPARVTKLRKPTLENRRFRVVADERGILEVLDKRLGRPVLKAGRYRPNEMVLERDEGSPWATLHPDRRRIPLGETTSLVAAEKTAAWQRLTFRAVTPDPRQTQGSGYECLTTVTLYRGIDRIDFVTDASWDTYNYRVRVAMPVPRRGRGIYGIPYGSLERQAYEPQFDWWTANGDWPAVNWAGIETAGASVALLNKGLPSYGIEDEKGGQVILLSVLRSPAVPTYLHEPSYYTMTDYDGMRDAGRHHFEYAVTAYDSPFAESRVVDDAEAYNAGFLAAAGEARLPQAPRVASDHVRLSALKWSETGRALVLRLFEFRGKSGFAEVTVPARARSASKVNLLERGGEPLAVDRGRVRIPVRAWEIATLRFDF